MLAPPDYGLSLGLIPIIWLPVLAIITPLALGFLLIFLGFITPVRLQAWLSFASSLLPLLFVVLMLPVVLDGQVIVHWMSGWWPPVGIVLTVDCLNAFVSLVVAAIFALSTLYSIKYMERETGLTYYYSLLMLMEAGLMGMTLTGDIFNLFVFTEIAGISAYALVSFEIERAEALEAGFKYAIMAATATTFIILGIALIYSVLGTVNMADVALRMQRGAFLMGGHAWSTLLIALAILMWGYGVKAAFVPLHSWLPDAHAEAPAPISAILSGVFIKVGVYAIIRIAFTVYGLELISSYLVYIATFGALSMVFAGFLALAQSDLKRMLAFSSVMNIGWILLGVGIGNVLGVVGGLFHLLNHAVLKALLFLISGAIIHETGVRDMRALGGLGRKMPITTFAFAIGGMGIAGVPPLNGFWSKWIILKAALEQGGPIYLSYVIVGITMSAVAVVYMFNALRSIFLGKPKVNLDNVREPPSLMLIPILVLMLIVVVLGIYPQLGLDLVEPAAKAVENQLNYVSKVLGGVM